MKSYIHRNWIIVLFVSMLLALANSVSFFSGILNQPKGTVYLGTVHYWEDYFFYLNHFFQGAHGAWLTVNRFTPELTQPSIIYWCNVLLGKFWLPPILAYNISLILLSFIALILSYTLAKKIFSGNTTLALWAFLYGNLATSLINYVKSNEGPMIWWPFQIWRTPHLVFDRLGGAPHQLIQTILAYLFLIGLFSIWKQPTNRKYLVLTVISGVLLTTLNPIQSLFYIGIVWMTILLSSIRHPEFISGSLFSKKETLMFLIVTCFVGITAVYINNVLSLPPHVQSKLWEATQHSYTTVPFLLLSIGPVFLLAVTGLLSRIKKLTRPETFGFLTVLVGYAVFMSKIPQTIGFSNLRILLPASYIFWGIFAAYGTEFISTKLSILHSRNQRSSDSGNVQKYIGIGIISVFFILSIPTLMWELQQKLPKTSDLYDPLINLPKPEYDGFDFLSRQGNFNDIVLASPTRHMDTLVPALSGHTTYSGHMLTTIDNSIKQANALNFFSGNKTQEFLEKNTIKYIIFTQYDGDKQKFEATYPFLKPVFSNTGITIYSLKS